MKNITLAIDEELLAQGRKYAAENNISFNKLVRNLVSNNISHNIKTTSIKIKNNIPEETETPLWLSELFALMDRATVSSQGDSCTRGDVRHG